MSDDPRGERSDHTVARVRVIGTGSLRTEPDEALVWITLTALERSPGDALQDVAQRGEALAAVLDELGVERADRSTSGITVQEEFDHTAERRSSLGHRALATMVVRLDNGEPIGQMMMRATRELDAHVRGPSWRVSAHNPVWLEVARLASKNAQQKAAAFAEGVDAHVGRLLTLVEEGDGRPGGIARAAARMSIAGPEPPVEAGEHEVTTTAQAEFELSFD
jgi:uncharacterized protein